MRRKRGILQNGVFVDPARAVAPHPSRLAGLLGYQDWLDQPRATRAGATRRQMLAGAPRGGVGRTQRRAQRRVGLSSVWWPHAATRSVRVGPYLSSISVVPDRPEPLVEWLESSLNEIAGRDPLGLNTISTDRVLPPAAPRDPPAFRASPVFLHLSVDALAVRPAAASSDDRGIRSAYPSPRVRVVPGDAAVQVLQRRERDRQQGAEEGAAVGAEAIAEGAHVLPGEEAWDVLEGDPE